MKTKIRYSIISLIVVACITSLDIRAARPDMPVVVNNDDANPVPVTGAVSVDNDATNPVPVILQDPVTVNIDGRYRFIGFSTLTYPSRGSKGMDSHCQTTFGDGARMCNTKEYFDTTGQVAETERYAWVRPHVIGTSYDFGSQTVADRVYPRSIITYQVYNAPDCDYWSVQDDTSFGYAISFPGSDLHTLNTRSCDNQFPIVCCASQ